MILSETSKEKHFNRVYLETYGKLYSLFLKLMQDEDLVKDILQRAYIKIWERWSKIADKENLYPLIYTCAKNMMIDEMRSNQRKSRYTKGSNEAHHYQTAEDQYILKEYRIVVDRVISRMPARRKEVYMLSREKGMSHQKISEQLSISKNTIERHLQDALKSVREELKLHFSYPVLLPLFLAYFNC